MHINEDCGCLYIQLRAGTRWLLSSGCFGNRMSGTQQSLSGKVTQDPVTLGFCLGQRSLVCAGLRVFIPNNKIDHKTSKAPSLKLVSELKEREQPPQDKPSYIEENLLKGWL